MNKLKQIIEETDTKSGKNFDIFIQILIITSLVSFSIETLPNLDSRFKDFLDTLEFIIVAIFSFEYLLRLYASKAKLKYIFSFYGLVDLIAILPFYLSKSVDLRSIRIIRLVRILRSFKLLRYSRALKRFQTAFLSVKEEMILFLFATFFLLFVASFGIYHFENPTQPENFKSIFHSLWWAIITLTTVGYGDVYPITAGGKIFTFLLLIIGMGIVAIRTALIASALTKHGPDDDQK